MVTTTDDIAGTKQAALSKKLILLMSIACGMAVANLYYNQPLLADMGRTFHATVHQISNFAMFTQIGYAVGMFIFVPMGDMKERRNMIAILLIAGTISLIGVATAQNLLWMNIASLAVGVTTVAPQIILPLAAQLAAPMERGKMIGTIMGGIFIWILLARTIAGFIGEILGWRTMYWLAAALMLALAAVLWTFLPKSYPESRLSYPGLYKSI